MFRIAVNHYKKLSLPLSSHTRDCWVALYADRTEIKIPLHNEQIQDKPVVVFDNDYLTVIFNKIDGSRQCLPTGRDYE